MKTIYDIFDEMGIEHELHEHPPFRTCEDAESWCRENTDELSGESKNLFLRDRKGNEYYLVVMESKKRLDLKKLQKTIAERRLSFASEETLKRYLNLAPGSVSVLALIFDGARDVNVIFDTDLLKYEKLHYHPPGRNDQTVILKTKDLKRFMDWTGNSLRFIKL
jgi:Ala-tRNA(Pro) deacylase